jgi:hypothetical protein
LISVVRKVKKDRWLENYTRQRQQYWWKGFLKQLAREGISEQRSIQALENLLQRSQIVATHSLKYYEIISFRDQAHRIFAVTPALGFG